MKEATRPTRFSPPDHSLLRDPDSHLSHRNPQDPHRSFFLASAALASPAAITSRADFIEYRISDGEPVDADEDPQHENDPEAQAAADRLAHDLHHAERYVHSEIYKRYADVQSIVHARGADAVLPFASGSVPLRAVVQEAGVMGPQVPIFDISRHYRSTDTTHSLLIDSPHLGAALAAGFSPTTALAKTTNLLKNMLSSQPTTPADPFPPYPVVLHRTAGFTCVGATLEEAVYRAVTTVRNARVQTQALVVQSTHNLALVAEQVGKIAVDGGQKGSAPARQEGLRVLSEREAKDAWAANRRRGAVERSWRAWEAEVRRGVPGGGGDGGFYVNDLEKPETGEM